MEETEAEASSLYALRDARFGNGKASAFQTGRMATFTREWHEGVAVAQGSIRARASGMLRVALYEVRKTLATAGYAVSDSQMKSQKLDECPATLQGLDFMSRDQHPSS